MFTFIRQFILLTKPFFVFGAFLIYALGVGIARYLGYSINWQLYVLGQAWVLFLQLTTHLLNEYYNYEDDRLNPNPTFFTGGSKVVGDGMIPPNFVLVSAIVILTSLCTISIIMIDSFVLSSEIYIIMVIASLGAVGYSLPPFRIERTGFGEIVTVFLVSILLPAFSFILQTREMHQLLPMVTFPLACINLAMLLTFNLVDYGADIKTGKGTMMVRLGWEIGMNIHNIMILSGFLLLGISTLFRFPSRIALPVLMILPVGLLEIWQIQKIRNGAKPNWNLLTLNSTTLFGSFVYLEAIGFWLY